MALLTSLGKALGVSMHHNCFSCCVLQPAKHRQCQVHSRSFFCPPTFWLTLDALSSMHGLYIPSLCICDQKASTAFSSMLLSGYLNAFHCMLVANGIYKTPVLKCRRTSFADAYFPAPDLKGLITRQMT